MVKKVHCIIWFDSFCRISSSIHILYSVGEQIKILLWLTLWVRLWIDAALINGARIQVQTSELRRKNNKKITFETSPVSSTDKGNTRMNFLGAGVKKLSEIWRRHCVCHVPLSNQGIFPIGNLQLTRWSRAWKFAGDTWLITEETVDSSFRMKYRKWLMKVSEKANDKLNFLHSKSFFQFRSSDVSRQPAE